MAFEYHDRLNQGCLDRQQFINFATMIRDGVPLTNSQVWIKAMCQINLLSYMMLHFSLKSAGQVASTIPLRAVLSSSKSLFFGSSRLPAVVPCFFFLIVLSQSMPPSVEAVIPVAAISGRESRQDWTEFVYVITCRPTLRTFLSCVVDNVDYLVGYQ